MSTAADASLKDYLSYDLETGVFHWKKNPPFKKVVGRPAGRVTNHGYVQVKFNRRMYSAHRLAWYFVFGKWPDGMIDHINGEKLDNRISNLRIVSNRQNQQNQRVHRDGRLPGTRQRANGRWEARVSNVYLGMFNTPEEAHLAYHQYTTTAR